MASSQQQNKRGFSNAADSKADVKRLAPEKTLPVDDGGGQLPIGTPGRLGIHDVGGIHELLGQKVDVSEVPAMYWEQKIHATVIILTSKGLLVIDELRRSVEGLNAADYIGWDYYARWALCVANILVEHNLIAEADLHEALGGNTKMSSAPLFEVGGRVRVRSEQNQEPHWRKPHLRTPGYIYGVSGVIVSNEGSFNDPTLAVMGIISKQRLYRVCFQRKDVWPEVESGDDTIEVDIYEPWLEIASGLVNPPQESGAKLACYASESSSGHIKEGEHDHEHLSRVLTEQKAVDLEGEQSSGERVAEAILQLLLSKSLVDMSSISRAIETLESASRDITGSKLVAEAWTDPKFKERLLADASVAAAELGISATNSTSHTMLKVVESTETTHNLIVCTLCSCYPVSLLGLPPAWYKGRCYRARAVREPRELLADSFGLAIPESVSINVLDSTADIRYLVIPMRPSHTDGWSKEKLASIVSRNSMIGVDVLKSPPC